MMYIAGAVLSMHDPAGAVLSMHDVASAVLSMHDAVVTKFNGSYMYTHVYSMWAP